MDLDKIKIALLALEKDKPEQKERLIQAAIAKKKLETKKNIYV